MSNAHISVIIPIYNAEKYLKKCLNAISNQTLRDIEIICINDGSNDSSAEILSNYSLRDKRFIIINQPNLGPAAARNSGLEIASGDYIMFCDSDDWYEPEMCKTMYSTILMQKTDFCICDCYIFKDSPDYDRGNENYHYLNISGFINLTQKNKLNIKVMLWNKIFKRDLIKRYAINFPEKRFHDDDAFIYQYVSASYTAYAIKKKLYNYRQHVGSVMHDTLYKKKKDHDHIHSTIYAVDFILRNNLSYRNEMLINEIIRRSLEWEFDKAESPNDKKEAIAIVNNFIDYNHGIDNEVKKGILETISYFQTEELKK